jgi:hypothetical protein
MAQGILAATHLGTPSTGDPTPVDYGIEDPGATVEDDAPASYPPIIEAKWRSCGTSGARGEEAPRPNTETRGTTNGG